MRYVSEIEQQIIRAALDGAYLNFARDFELYDGEETAVPKGPMSAVIAEIGETETSQVIFFADDGERLGWALFIHGNGVDVLSDYSANDWTEKALTKANELAQRLAES